MAFRSLRLNQEKPMFLHHAVRKQYLYFSFLIILFEVSGSIKSLDYGDSNNGTLQVYSDCDFVRMTSTLFKISNKDYVKIGNTEYKNSTQIDTILSSNFTVAFQFLESKKKKEFVLKWSCVIWSEWIPTQTCTEVISLKPEYNGPDIKYRAKYRKTNETCST